MGIVVDKFHLLDQISPNITDQLEEIILVEARRIRPLGSRPEGDILEARRVLGVGLELKYLP